MGFSNLGWVFFFIFRVMNIFCLKITQSLHHSTKGQIKPKVDWRAKDSPKKQRKNFFFAYLPFTAKKTKFVCLFFGRIYGGQICLKFYLTFSFLNFLKSVTYKGVSYKPILRLVQSISGGATIISMCNLHFLNETHM